MHRLLLDFDISYLQTSTHTSANSADPDETARNEPSHQDLHCFPFWYWFLTETPICNNDEFKIKDGKLHFINSGLKGLSQKGRFSRFLFRLCYMQFFILLTVKQSYLLHETPSERHHYYKQRQIQFHNGSHHSIVCFYDIRRSMGKGSLCHMRTAKALVRQRKRPYIQHNKLALDASDEGQAKTCECAGCSVSSWPKLCMRSIFSF